MDLRFAGLAMGLTMGHITKVTDSKGHVKYKAYVHRKGCKQINKRFTDPRDADRWIREQERSIDITGLPLSIGELRKHTLAELVERYLKEKTPAKGCAVNEAYALNTFLRHPLCRQSLPISKQDAYKYINERLKDTWKGKPITARTVSREKHSIQHIFEVAREEWGFSNLPNPFLGIEIKGSTYKRQRRLNEGEYGKLRKACHECLGINRHYVPLAINLAIETAMRLDEIFNLRWPDIDISKRTITIRESKTDHVNDYAGRTIVMSVGAFSYLVMIPQLDKDGSTIKDTRWPGHNGRRSLFPTVYQSNDRIFPMTKQAFKQAFKKLTKRAGITGLQFRDLRREAGSRFDEAGLTKAEHDLMMGHKNTDIKGIYIVSHLKRIQDKLDRYSLDGNTFDEAIAKNYFKWATDAHSTNNTPPSK